MSKSCNNLTPFEKDLFCKPGSGISPMTQSMCNRRLSKSIVNILASQVNKSRTMIFRSLFSWKWKRIYLIPIKIHAPLIFVHLACAKIKGSKFAQYKSAKIKGRRKMPQMNENKTSIQWTPSSQTYSRNKKIIFGQK